MTIEQAILSGKSFRRPGLDWQLRGGVAYKVRAFSIEDVLAEDWEVKEEKIEIARSRLKIVIELLE